MGNGPRPGQTLAGGAHEALRIAQGVLVEQPSQYPSALPVALVAGHHHLGGAPLTRTHHGEAQWRPGLERGLHHIATVARQHRHMLVREYMVEVVQIRHAGYLEQDAPAPRCGLVQIGDQCCAKRGQERMRIGHGNGAFGQISTYAYLRSL